MASTADTESTAATAEEEMTQHIAEGPVGFEALLDRLINDSSTQKTDVPNKRPEVFYVALECAPGAAAELATEVCNLLSTHRVGQRPIVFTSVLHKDTRLLCWFRIKKGGGLMSKNVDPIFHPVTGVNVRQVVGQQLLTEKFSKDVVSMFEKTAPASCKFPTHGPRSSKQKSKQKDKDYTWSRLVNKLMFEPCPPGENLDKHKAAVMKRALRLITDSDNVGGVFTKRNLRMRVKAFKKLFDIVQEQLQSDGLDDPEASSMSPGEAIARLRENRTNLVQCAKLELQSRCITNSFKIRQELGSTLSDLQETVSALAACEAELEESDDDEEEAAAATAAAGAAAATGAADMDVSDAEGGTGTAAETVADMENDEAVESVPDREPTPEPGFVES
jgi:hypothetical protein